MPKGKGKGGKNRRRGKGDRDGAKRELILKDEGQEYAQVLKMLGQGRLEAQCVDGVKRLCHIRGKMKKRVWINQGDVVLVSLRDFQDNKCDVIMKYSADEARTLKAQKHLPDNLKINETDIVQDDESSDGIEFGDDVSDVDLEDI